MIIRSFKVFESVNYEEIHKICSSLCSSRYMDNYTVNNDGTVDVDGDVELYNIGLEKIPLKFREVKGEFTCSMNKLESLEGCPEIVGGRFYCNRNELTSLVGGPKSVNGNYSFEHNNVTSFEGFPDFVSGKVSCIDNPIYEIYRMHPSKDFIEMLNEYKVIQGNKIIEIRFRQALEDSNAKFFPKSIRGYEMI